MRVGIVEVCEPNHYSSVQALAQTYAYDRRNEVLIFTISKLARLLRAHPLDPNTKIIEKGEGESVGAFFERINGSQLDRIHLNTLSAYLTEALQTDWRGQVVFTVHNVEQWFDNGFINRSRLWLSKAGTQLGRLAWKDLYQTTVLYAKDFYRQRRRDTLMQRFLQNNALFLVYSRSQQTYLTQFVAASRTLVFPFALYDGLPDRSAPGQKLRICVPGSVSVQRRDYVSLLAALETNLEPWKSRIIIDLLGFITPDAVDLIPRFERLNEQGLEVLYYRQFLSAEAFDEALSRADLILVNVHVKLNLFQQYSRTKESGGVFNMIKSAKPGLLPVGYAVDEELRACCLFFDSYGRLEAIIHELLDTPGAVDDLKQTAHRAALQYTAPALLPRLIHD